MSGPGGTNVKSFNPPRQIDSFDGDLEAIHRVPPSTNAAVSSAMVTNNSSGSYRSIKHPPPLLIPSFRAEAELNTVVPPSRIMENTPNQLTPTHRRHSVFSEDHLNQGQIPIVFVNVGSQSTLKCPLGVPHVLVEPVIGTLMMMIAW